MANMLGLGISLGSSQVASSGGSGSSSTAALTSTAGPSCSKLLTVTGTPKLTATVNSGGAIILSRSDTAQQHTDAYSETTVGTIAVGGQVLYGITDQSTIDFNGGGAGFFGGGGAYPGDGASFPGFTIFVDGASAFVGWRANGTSGAFSAGGTGNTAAGDIIGVEYNQTSKIATIFYKRGAGAMAQIGTLTLTSNIPLTAYVFAGGKQTNDADSWNPGNVAFALGSTGPNGSPSGSNIYG